MLFDSYEQYHPPASHPGSEMLAISTSTDPVGPAPAAVPWKDRRMNAFAASATAPHNMLRIGSFNVLADDYTRTEMAVNSMFCHTDKETLSFKYRGPRIAKEILGLDSHIIALQEW